MRTSRLFKTKKKPFNISAGKMVCRYIIINYNLNYVHKF